MAALLEKPVLNRKGQKDHEIILPLAEELWGLQLRPRSREGALLMEYYNAKTATIDPGFLQPSCHNDIVHMVSLLKDNNSKTLKQLTSMLLASSPKCDWLNKQSEDVASKALRLAASIWLMCSTANWQEAETFPAFLEKTRDNRATVNAPTGDRPPEFRVSAKALNQIAGIDIVWTSDLNEHLYFDEIQRTVTLFRHAALLKERSGSGHPADYLRETASTIALLFPYGESSSRAWMRRMRKKADTDVEVGLSMALNRDPQDYKYWSKQLIIIHAAFQRSKPTSLRQWYHDKRDGSQFYGFWLAVFAIILTLMFGLIQSITGILQVLKT
jgi:hypothetical protein